MGKEANRQRPDGLAVADYWQLFGLDHLPYRILLVGRMIDRLTVQHVRSIGAMSVAEWRVLAHLAVMGEKSASAVSAAALVERSEVSRAVSALTQAGLIEQKPNPANQKSKLLALTEAGDARFRLLQRERQRFFAAVMADVPPHAAAAFDATLLRIAARVEQMSQDPTQYITGAAVAAARQGEAG